MRLPEQPNKPTVVGQSMGTIPSLVAATLLYCKTIAVECRVISPELIQDIFNLSNYIYQNSKDKSKLIKPTYERVWQAITEKTTILNIITPNWWNSWRSPLLTRLSDKKQSKLKYYTFGSSSSPCSLLDTTLFGTHRGSKSLAPLLLDNNINFYKPKYIPLTSSEAIYVSGIQAALSYIAIGCFQFACLSVLASPLLLPVTGSFALTVASTAAVLSLCMLIREGYKAINGITNKHPRFESITDVTKPATHQIETCSTLKLA